MMLKSMDMERLLNKPSNEPSRLEAFMTDAMSTVKFCNSDVENVFPCGYAMDKIPPLVILE